MELKMWITAILLCWMMAFMQQARTHEHGDGYKPDGEIQRVLVNGTAQIKCDVSSNLPNDQVLLVVWYKNNLPIYSYDTRGTHAGTPSHWRDEEVLEDRAMFRTIREPAELIIAPVLEKDAGNFRCRVDFKLSQTRNSNVNLEVVVPPQSPKIFNERGENIESRAGPYEEGGDLHLTCVVMGGNPPPIVTWSMNGQTLSSTMLDFTFPMALRSKLVVKNLSRIHQHAVYTCQASNFHKKFISTNITIELYLRPLLVDISFGNQPISADRKYEIECQAVGSRPPAKLTWWMGNIELHGHNQKVSADGNVSLSVLSLTPTREDHGKVLVCRATNELVKNGIKETSMKLNVFFTPTLQLDLGSNLNPEDIEEGDDVYFECKVHANPAAYKVIWKHNNQIIQHNQRAGVIVSSGDLALQGVTRHQAGNYTCIASNVEGDGDSNIVQLKVMYKPICRPDQKKIYGVARNEAADILCEVDAFPPPESFKWSFNNTAETFDMPQSGFRLHSAQASTLTYTPVKEMDFGTIMCWADNVVGQQKEPCVFHLIAAGKPDMPYNCSLVNQTSESLEVDCNEGFDGGQRQWFIMEIYDLHTGMLEANISSKYPIFQVNGLEAGRFLKILIYGVNIKGRSDAVVVEGYTLKAAEKEIVALTSFKGSHHHTSGSNFEFTPILSIGILIGILLVFLCIAIATVAALKMRTTARQQHKYQQGGVGGKGMTFSRPGNLPIKDKISLPLSHSEEMYDEKNPDVVPYNEADGEYKLKSASQTPSAINSSRASEPELASKLNDERKGFINVSNDELHYAELALSIPLTTTKTNQVTDCLLATNNLSNSTILLTNNSNNNNSCSTLTRQQQGNKHPALPTTTGAIAEHHQNNPPAYDYFDEPTIYAQIDHYKSQHHPHHHHQSHHPTTNLIDPNSNVAGSMIVAATGSTYPPSLISPANSHTSSTSTNVMVYLPASQQHSTGTGISPVAALNTTGNLHQQHQQMHHTLPPLPVNASTLKHHHQTLPPAIPSAAVTPIGVVGTAVSPVTAAATSKPFSREIVTVRTPLMYAQQESCV